jgi:hypothetical protein
MSLQIIENYEIGAISQNVNKTETKPPGFGFGEHDVGGMPYGQGGPCWVGYTEVEVVGVCNWVVHEGG